MKNIYILTIIAIITFSCNSLVASTVKFITLGNCYTCKLRIEGALKGYPGIKIAVWDETSDATTIVFDDVFHYDLNAIMKIIAGVGHDTEWYRAPDTSYNKLIGTCCEYLRDRDYSSIQIGYLSLMDMWVSVNNEADKKPDISIYPTLVNNGLLNISSDLDYSNDYQINIYNVNGAHVYTGILTDNGSFDISILLSGYYLVIISDNKRTVFNGKIIVV